MKIRCQIRMIDLRQVDVEVEKDISPALLMKAIEEQAEREFGESDRIEVFEIENVSPVMGGAQQSVNLTRFPQCQTCEYNPCDFANNSDYCPARK